MSRWPLWLLFSAVSVSACADGRTIRYSTGTGFFIHREGYLLTNHHVIANCARYSVYAKNATLQATLIASDKEHDLALLKTSMPVEHAARFARAETQNYSWDSLLIMGYPEHSWQSRKPVVTAAQFVANKGPRGEDWLLQFSDSVKKGNSGGPLLSASGSVIGIIQAKASTLRINRSTHQEEEINRADLAINLPTVTRFLEEHGVSYNVTQNDAGRSHAEIAREAEQYIVNIRCPQH